MSQPLPDLGPEVPMFGTDLLHDFAFVTLRWLVAIAAILKMIEAAFPH